MFAQPNGRPIDPKADHQAWKELLEEAGVREAWLHDVRLTTATMLLVFRRAASPTAVLDEWLSFRPVGGHLSGAWVLLDEGDVLVLCLAIGSTVRCAGRHEPRSGAVGDIRRRGRASIDRTPRW